MKMEITGDVIRGARGILGLSQERFAARFGGTAVSVCRWEGGARIGGLARISLAAAIRAAGGLVEVRAWLALHPREDVVKVAEEGK